MEICHILLSTYFLLGLVLVSANFLFINILISNVLNSASSIHSIGNNGDVGPAVNEVSETPRINFAFSLEYLEWFNDIKNSFSVAYICCSYFKSV